VFGTCREAFESITSADVKLDDDAGIGDRVGQRVQGAAFFRDLTARGLTGVRLVTPRLVLQPDVVAYGGSSRLR
jgi:hypothetical protein